MDDSVPFLPAKIEGSDRHHSLRWLKLRHYSNGNVLKSGTISHVAVFIAATLLWGGIYLIAFRISPHPSSLLGHDLVDKPTAVHHAKFLADEINYLTCGTSLAEAKARRCVYDTLSNAWIPKQCEDNFSVMEYEADGSWFPFADANRTLPLQKEDLGDREFYYTSLRDHIVHCAALWRRQFRAWSEGWTYLDDVLVDPVHTMHCSKYLVDLTDRFENDFRTHAIKVEVGHVGCHVLG
jgi:hypothetical protein